MMMMMMVIPLCRSRSPPLCIMIERQKPREVSNTLSKKLSDSRAIALDWLLCTASQGSVSLGICMMRRKTSWVAKEAASMVMDNKKSSYNNTPTTLPSINSGDKESRRHEWSHKTVSVTRKVLLAYRSALFFVIGENEVSDFWSFFFSIARIEEKH